MTSSDTAHSEVHPPRLRVVASLAAMLKSMEPGDQLPPEPALAKQLGVSRSTLREGLRMFVERGVLIRRHGVGTFVVSRFPVLESGLEVLESLDSMAHQMGLETEVADLDVLERAATLEEREGLQLAEKHAVEVLVVNRVIAVEGEPVAYLKDVVPLTYLHKEDLGEAFRGSVLDVLLERGTPMLANSRTAIVAEVADAGQAACLKIEEGTALLKLTGQLYSYDEKVVDYSTSYFVPGYFKFHVMRRVNLR